MKIKPKYLIILLMPIGAFLRFYNLTWGAPFYFHPDERNIASLILQTSLADPGSLLSGTFAYGNFPMILTHLLKPLFLPFFKLFNLVDPFAQAIIILRSISTIFSVLTLYVVYLAGKLWSEKINILTLFLTVFSTGLIQQAHFGTYDGLAAFSAVTTFYFSLKFLKTKKISHFYFVIIFISLGAAAKINLLILGVFPFLILAAMLKKKKASVLFVLKHALLGIILILTATVLLSPNYLTPEFRNALFYERGLVTGETPVFYTQSFSNTTPILFQFLNIYPFLINPVLTLIFIPAFFYILLNGIKTKNRLSLLLASFFLLLFLPQAFLHAKWTRYMVPALPFMYLIISIVAIGLLDFAKKKKQILNFMYLVFGIIVLSSLLFSLSYFITAFVRPDTRIEAAEFLKVNFPSNSRIITEPYDLGIIPFNSNFYNIETFNFYELDSSLISHLSSLISNTDYIILPSQRLLRSRLQNPDNFPKGHEFYTGLLNGSLGFEKIYETSCDTLCMIAYLGNPVFSLEETASVFDRPTVMIFRRSNF